MDKYWKSNILCCFLLCLLGCLISLFLGQATNEFDVYNYHIYAPWALFNGRIGVDVLPAGIRSYFNPMLDFYYYFLLKYFNSMPKLVAFCQGIWYGLVLFSVYKISTLFKFDDSIIRNIFNFFVILFTAISPIMLIECGSLWNDLPIAFFILLGMYFYLKALFRDDSNRRTCYIVAASFIFGATVGLKLTSALMILSIVISSLFFIKNIDKPLKVFLYSLISGISGFILVDGWWYIYIWSVFKNPLFPYFNSLFHSPFGQNSLVVNDSYVKALPTGIFNKLFYPFRYYSNGWSGFGSWLFEYNDLRYAAGTIGVIFLFLRRFFKKSDNVSYNDRLILFLALFLTFTYLMWLNLFCIIRYIIPIIPIISIIIVYIIVKIFGNFIKTLISYDNKTLLITVLSILICIFLHFQNINLLKYRTDYSKKVFPAVKFEIEDNSLVILSSQTFSYLIPQLNKSAKYFMLIHPLSVDVSNGANSYNMTRTIDYYYSKYYEDLLLNEINSHENIYIIVNKNIFSDSNKNELDIVTNSLNYYFGKVTDNYCKTLDNRTYICKITK